MTKRIKLIALCGIIAAAAVIAVIRLCGTQGGSAISEPSQALIDRSNGLADISVSARLDDGARTLSVVQSLTLPNNTGKAQSSVVLRAWANAFQSVDTSPAALESVYKDCYPDGFSSGALQMHRVCVLADGAETDIEWRYLDEQKTVLSLPLPFAWDADASVTLSLEYEVTVPRAAYRFGVWDGVYALGNAFVTPAPYENGEWRTDPYYNMGDPLAGDCANYVLSLDLPAGFKCAGSAAPDIAERDDRVVYDFNALAVRDFALVAGMGLKEERDSLGSVALISLASDAGTARKALKYMKRALSCYQSLYGDYPYPSMSCAEIVFPMGGMEYPAFLMLSRDMLSLSDESVEYLLAHETAHQWWYAVVGSDSVNQAWQDEALCEFSALKYYETCYGRTQRDELENTRVQSAMKLTIPGGLTPGMPVDYFDDLNTYSLVVYLRGAAFFCALDRLLPDGLMPALREYYARYAFKRATRDELISLIAELSGEDIAPLAIDYLDTEM